MTMRPTVGDQVFMPAMGDDVCIEIADVLIEQPLVDRDGCFIVSDQYGEEHLIEMDADSWVTTSSDALSAEGQAIWAARSGSALTR